MGENKLQKCFLGYELISPILWLLGGTIRILKQESVENVQEEIWANVWTIGIGGVDDNQKQ